MGYKAQTLLRRFLRDAGGSDWGDFGPSANGCSWEEWKARRPSLPPVLFIAVATWVGIALCIDSLMGVKMDECRTVCLVGLAMLPPSAFALWRGSPVIGCIALGLSLGCALGAAHAYSLGVERVELFAQDGPCLVRAVQDSREGSYGSSFVARCDSGALVRVGIPKGEHVLVGDSFLVQGGWKRPTQQAAQSCWRKGIVGVANVKHLEKIPDGGFAQPLRAFRAQAIAGVRTRAQDVGQNGSRRAEAGSFLSAVVLGYTDGLYESELYQAVKVDGLAHLVAVSGAHLVIVSGMVGAAIKRTALSRSAGIVVQVMLILGYLVLTGAPTSAIRAAVMATLGFASYFGERRPYALGALSCCILGMLAIDPAASFSVSLLLSAGATAGIVLFCGYLDGFVQGACGLPASAVLETCALTLAASVFTAPVSACLFGQISLISPVANILVAPAFPFICIGGFAAIALNAIAAVPGAVAIDALLAALQVLCMLMEALSRMPFASCPASLSEPAAVLLAVVPAGIMWAAWPYPSPRLAAAAILLLGLLGAAIAVNPLLRADAITMLDVGQGDAILMQSCGRNVLIDTGNQDTALLQGLASCGVRDLDAVLITHPDDDHCGSLSSLRGIVGIGCVLVASDLLAADDGHCATLRSAARSVVGEGNIIGVRVGDSIDVGRIHLEVIAPDGFRDGGGNADSVIVLMRYDADGDGLEDATGLFCGDAEAPTVRDCIDEGRVGDIDLYKVGHHGSSASVDGPMLEVLHPEVSIVSVGEFNRYGHPAQNTLDALARAGSRIYRTDIQGCITCLLQKEGIVVRTQR